MHLQVGGFQINEQGVAQRGLLVRRPVLPNRLAGTREVVRVLAQEVSTHTYLNVMAQYRLAYKAHNTPQLSRSVLREEFNEAARLARQYGLDRLDKNYIPSSIMLTLRQSNE